MSTAPFLIADLHFGHKNLIEKYTQYDGTPERPYSTVDEMNRDLILRWNTVVPGNGEVYVLGDAAFGKNSVELIGQLNGKKCLIKGNHDLLDIELYIKYFYDVKSCHALGNFVLTHIPIHPQSVTRWPAGNIHGHLHHNVVLCTDGKPDPRYICVSADQINYTPISFNEIESLRSK
jgi:calcineurin-like phosphoesterase family protein